MKKLFNLAALLIVISLGACKDDELSAHDQKVKTLTDHSWGSPAVTHADGDLSSQYAELVIAFTKNSSNGFDGAFVIGNGGYAFPEPSGKWKLSEDLTQIIFDSGEEMEMQLSGDHLRLEFTVVPSGGRAAGLSGHFVFDLKPL